MKRWSGKGWEIICSRWAAAAPSAVDVTLTDPPYDHRTHANGRRGAGGEGEIFQATEKGFAPLTSPGLVAGRLLHLTKRWVVCFCSIEQIGDYARGAGSRWVRGGIWIKTDPVPQFLGNGPGVFGEALAIMHAYGKRRWNGGGKPAKWVYGTAKSGRRSGPEAGQGRVHPTQKPVGLMLQLVEDFSEPRELIWDPYCGSGTTGVAALRLGRRFLGHESNPEWAAVAAERLAAEERGLTLAAARAGQRSIFDLEA